MERTRARQSYVTVHLIKIERGVKNAQRLNLSAPSPVPPPFQGFQARAEFTEINEI